MKKNSHLSLMTLFVMFLLLMLGSSVVTAQNDILDLFVNPGDPVMNCDITPDIEINVNFDASGSDTVVIIKNISGYRLYNDVPADKSYKFCAPNSFYCGTTGSGEFQILFMQNSSFINTDKLSFIIYTNSGGSASVTAYQGSTGYPVSGISESGGLRYNCENAVTPFNKVVVTCTTVAAIDTEAELFVMDKMFMPSSVINNPPSDITISSNTINENVSAGADIGSFSNNDPDAGDSFTYSLVDGATYPDNASFTVAGNILKSNALFNFENKSSYSIRIQVDDGHSHTFSKEFVININDVTEIIPIAINNIPDTNWPENTPYAGPVPVITPAPIGSVTYLLSGTDADDFLINTGTGEVSMASRNYELPVDADLNNTYLVTITATDEDGNTDNESWTVTITDVHEDATFSITNITDSSIDENTPYSAIPSITGTPIGNITYSKSGPDAALFGLNTSTGQITLTGKDYEMPADAGGNNVYNVTLTATDEDDNANSLSWTVTILNKTETASFSIQPVLNATVAENTGYTSVTPSISGTYNGILTYSLEPAGDNDFSINSSTGVVSMAGQNFEEPADADINNVYNVSVRATDSDANYNTTSWTVTVTDVIEPSNFVIADIPDATVDENEEYTVTATIAPGVPPVGSVTYSLEGVDGGRFTVNPITGEVKMVARDFEYPEDYDNNNSYLVTAGATDADGNYKTASWTVSVANVEPENPPSVICLLDLSYSMNRDFYDMGTSDPNAVKLPLAKSALLAFIDLLHEFNPGKSSLGMARFPNSPQVGCDAGSIELIRTLTEEFKGVLTADINGLTAPGMSTPLLAGIDFAKTMFNTTNNKVIVLLSDGRQNCPTTSIPTSLITTYSNDLKSLGITLYTIGFGDNAIVPNDMLNAMATGTTIGAHYNIAAFSGKSSDPYDPSSPAAWDAGTALHAAYANIIVNGLGLESSQDPLDIIDQGAVRQFDVPITIFDDKVCFFVSWITPAANYLGVRLFTPSGTEISEQQAGVNAIHRNNHTIITLSNTILSQPGMTGTWSLRIDGQGLNNPTEHFQYTVLNSSKKLNLRTWFEKGRYYAGDQVMIFLELLLDKKPITGLDKIFAMGTRPAMSPGNWLVSKKVDDKMLEKVKQKQLEEYLKWISNQPRFENMNKEAQEKYISSQKQIFLKTSDPVELRVQALRDEYNLTTPGRVAINGLNFSDEGINGDQTAGDGIYTAVYVPKLEGSYSFNISCSDSSRGIKILRESHLQTYVGTRIMVRPVFKEVRLLKTALKGEKAFDITFRLKDRYGNIPLPGALNDVKLSIDRGTLTGGITDNMDGTFTQRITLPENIRPEKVKMTFSYDEMSDSRKISTGKILMDAVLISLLVIISGFIFIRKKQ